MQPADDHGRKGKRLREDAFFRHPAGILVAVSIVGAFAYSVAETMLLSETYAAGFPWLKVGAIALLGASAGLLVVRKVPLPGREKVALPILLGVAAGFAAYPGLLRINMLTDDDGLRSEAFRQAEDLRLVPLKENLPVIRAPRYDHYWRTFETGRIHEIEIRKGGLGFYQYDRAPIETAMLLEEIRRRLGGATIEVQ